LLKSYRYTHLDVFTDRIFGGNQLAVVLDGRGLSTGAMQAIAKEMNFSETTFVLPPERPDTDARVRIFTPAEELPTAGHPTIGTTYAPARAGIVAPPVDSLTLGLFRSPRAARSTVPSSRPTTYDAFRRAAGLDDVPVFLFSAESRADNGSVYSRMFAPGAGIQEDPATGSACARWVAISCTTRS
jgi:predicted PhzF superfamily epimerase YddE/YHI9